MPTLVPPSIEHWFQDSETGRSFRVIAIDTENDSIEIQFYDGDVDELDFGAWRDSLFIPIEAPEDARAPFDDVEIDDLGYSDTDVHKPSDRTLDDLLDERDAY